MANWKKIIVSGSNAVLNEITASSGLQLPGIASQSHASSTTTPLVIDSSGNVSTGSAYALASGGDTVGGEGLLSNIAIIGAGNSLIQTASSTQDADFNNASLKKINQLTASNAIFDSLALSGSFDGTGSSANLFNISFSSTESAALTIPSTTLNSIDFKIPVTMSNVPGGSSETKVLLIDNNGRVVTRSNSDLGGVTSVTGGTNISHDTSTGNVTLNLDDKILLSEITASAGLFFSGSTNKDYVIDYAKIRSSSGELVPESGSLQITASGLKVEGNIDGDGSITLDGALSFNGFSFTQTSVAASSGSTQFGSGSTGSALQLTNTDAVTHQFTGSILVTGSNINLVGGQFVGDGSQLTGLTDSNITLKSLHFDHGLNGSDTTYDAGGFATASIKLDGSTLFTSSAGIKVSESGIDTAQLKDGSVTSGKLNSNLISGLSTELTDFTTIGNTDELLISDDGTLKKVDVSLIKDYISSSLSSVFSANDTTFDLTATHSVGTTDTVIRLKGTDSSVDDVQIEGASNEIDITLDDVNNKITVGLRDSITVPTASITQNLSVGNNLSVAGNTTINGNLNVLGNTTTISTQDLVVEDRYIFIGSGSTNSQDIGIVFNSGSVNGDSKGRGIIFDADKQRFSTAKNFDADHGDAAELTGNQYTGDLLTIKINQTTPPSPNSSSFGEGEMYIDNNNDVWIYVETPPGA